MNLYYTIKSLVLQRNRINYLYCIITICLYIVIMTSFSFLMDNLIFRIAEQIEALPYIRVTFRSLNTVFYIAGAVYILNLYIHVLAMNRQEYNILNKGGATKRQLDLIMIIQSLCLIIFTIPLGVGLGILLIQMVSNVLGDISGRIYSLNYPSVPMYITLFVLLITIIVLNFYPISDAKKKNTTKLLCRILVTKITSI